LRRNLLATLFLFFFSETKDLNQEGIATLRFDNRIRRTGRFRNQRPEPRRDCDLLIETTKHALRLFETKDLNQEGIATILDVCLFCSLILETKDLNQSYK